MPRGKAEPQNSSHTVSLQIGESLPAAWEGTLLPWFESVSQNPLIQNQPAVVITPSAAQATWLRAKLLERDVSLIGVQFLTPAILRELLLQKLGLRVPLREHLRLILSAAAEELLSAKTENESSRLDPDYLATQSVARAPDYFLRSVDQFSGGGWDFSKEGTSSLRPLFLRFREQMRNCGFDLIYEADRELTKNLQSPLFSNSLIAGFDGAHWALWPLLCAVAQSARTATVALTYPTEQSRTIDEAWIGTWEQTFGATVPIDGRKHCDALPPEPAPSSGTGFFIGLNTTEQAETIVAVALNFLSANSCLRLGIVFPHNGVLSRLVATLLAKNGLPHNDAIGHPVFDTETAQSLGAWIALQQNHQLSSLLRFLNASFGKIDAAFESISFGRLQQILQRVYRKILIDDVSVTREYCARQTDHPDSVAAAKLLERIKFLPNRATFSEFLKLTNEYFDELDWKARWDEIEPFTRDWSAAIDSPISRSVFLQWLKEITQVRQKTRSQIGNHPYSRIHLLTYEQAAGQEWTHVILAGLNQGEWPPSENESRWLNDARISELNARALQQGKQGEGHLTVRDGKTFLLGANHRRQIANRRFQSVLSSATDGGALTASLLHESAPERIWNPSELFTQKYFEKHETALTQSVLATLRQQTRAWLDQQIALKSPVHSGTNGVEQTRVAYDKRRSNKEFGEYEFALREPISRQVTLRATQWDKVTKSPALIWLKVYLGVESTERSINEWAAATGDWVHDWLRKISGATSANVFVNFPSESEISERIRNAAAKFRAQVEELCSSCQRTLPDWWTSGWSTALTLAHCLSENLNGLSQWPDFAAEWVLDSPQLITLAGGKQLRFRGRIDVILKRSGEGDFAGADLWIVDYKTGGSAKPLRPTSKTPESRKLAVFKKLVRGEAIQLGLYALAARELGASDIALSILSAKADLERPQLKINDIEEQPDFWNDLFRMQESGVFGVVGPMRSEFSFSADLPLATIPLDNEFLREKWAQTHPDLVDEEER